MRIHCLYDDYLHALEYVRRMDEPVHAPLVSRHLDGYLQRGWLREAGYYHGDTIEDGDGFVAEVDYTLDLDAGVYRYPNPFWAGATIVKPIRDITYYAFCVDRFLDDLAALIGIEHRAKKVEVITAYLWELGQVRIGGADQWARVFIARHEHGSPYAQIRAWLDDEVCPGQSLLLVHRSANPPAFGEHIERCLSDLLDVDAGVSHFRTDKLQRILERNSKANFRAEIQEEYVSDTHVYLKHLAKPMELTNEQVRLVRQAWGPPHKKPPIYGWNALNKLVNTGYNSFDNAFGDDTEKRELIFAKVRYGQYQLRRAVIQKL